MPVRGLNPEETAESLPGDVEGLLARMMVYARRLFEWPQIFSFEKLALHPNREEC